MPTFNNVYENTLKMGCGSDKAGAQSVPTGLQSGGGSLGHPTNSNRCMGVTVAITCDFAA